MSLLSLARLSLSATLFCGLCLPTCLRPLLLQPPPIEKQVLPALSDADNKALDIQMRAGIQARNRQKFAEAEKLFQDGLAKAQVLKAERFAAHFYREIGELYRLTGRYPQALENFTHGLELREKMGTPYEISQSLSDLGILYDNVQQFPRAIAFYRQALAIREKSMPDSTALADVLDNLANTYTNSGQPLLAIPLQERALPLYRAKGSPQDLAFALNNFGMTCKDLGQYEKAGKLYAEALTIKEALGNPLNISTTLTNLGNLALDRGRYEEALKYHYRALELKQTANNPHDLAGTHNNLGNVYAQQGETEKAREQYTKAVQLGKRSGILHDTIIALNGLGTLFYSQGDYRTAKEYFQQALKLLEGLDNAGERVTLKINLCSLYMQTGEFRLAEEALQDARSLERSPDPQKKVLYLNRQGLLYQHRQEYEKALEYDRRILALNEKYGNPFEVATTQNNMAGNLIFLARYREAEELLNRALPVLQKEGNILKLAEVYNTLGVLYQEQGQYDKSLDFLDRSFNLQKISGRTHGYLLAMNNLANCYGVIGQSNMALSLYRQMRELNKKQALPDVAIAAATGIAMIYQHQLKFDEFIREYQTAIALCEITDQQQGLILNRNNLANTYLRAGYLREGRTILTSLLRAKEPASLSQRIYFLIGMGNVCILQKQYQEAGKWLEEARKLAEPTANFYTLAPIYKGLTTVQERTGTPATIEAAYRRAIDADTHLEQQVRDPGKVGLIQETNPGTFAYYADFLRRQGRREEALIAVEQGRGHGFARLLEQNRATTTVTLRPEDANRLELLREEQLRAAKRVQANTALFEPNNPAERDRLTIALNQAKESLRIAEQNLTVFQDGLYIRYPRYRNVSGAKPFSLPEMRRLAAQNPDTLYLEWALKNDTQTLLFAFSQSTGLRILVLPVGRKQLAQQVTLWREAIEQRSPQETGLARALYRMLLKPVEPLTKGKGLAIKNLVLVADGVLLNLPFAALMDANGKRLVERYNLSSAISLNALLWPTMQRPLTGKKHLSLLCAADSTGKENAPFKVVSRGNFKPLPSARREGREVAQMVPGALILVGAEAREGEIKKHIVDSELLHFATHGDLNTANGLRSGLILAPEPPDSKEDGVLEAREIVGIPLAARLTVLSACQSGQGESAGGEGLVGLSWAFQAAGCPAVVASQWKVEDQTTHLLMVAFYRALRAGKRKDAALREAMLSVKKTDASPYYWSAFQVFGDIVPVPAKVFATRSR